ncbi:hypothetical protein ACFY93_27120 [Streptomyces sp. NPDC008313]|uniref:hypothetical protein n=1 Tax=Streptomyces sp. NPDC008313 TaxID=3364826 RepID=UPI0036EED607
MAAIAAVVALGVSALSMLYLARQTKAAAEQAKISNAVAAVSANDMVLRSLREVHTLMLQHPGSRRCFYDSMPLPTETGRRDAIVTIAELLADVLTSGIHVHRNIPGSASAEAWEDYCRSVLVSSPVLRDLVRTHSAWWPYLSALLPVNQPGPAAC